MGLNILTQYPLRNNGGQVRDDGARQQGQHDEASGAYLDIP